jgi:hypothetical protein
MHFPSCIFNILNDCYSLKFIYNDGSNIYRSIVELPKGLIFEIFTNFVI